MQDSPSILIISSGFSPIPAIKGGAVETLTTILIDLNENCGCYKFIVCGLDDKDNDISTYCNCSFVSIKIGKTERIIEKILNRFGKILNRNININFYNIKLFNELKRRKIKPDYVLFENSVDLFEKISGLFPASKLLLHLHNDLNSVSKTPVMALRIAQRADRIIFVSDFLRNRFIEVTKCDNEKCKILYNCMDMTRELDDVSHEKVQEMVNNYRIDIKKKIFLYVGRLNEEKGILELAKAFSKLNEKNATLIVCGGTWGTEFKMNRYLHSIMDAIHDVRDQVIFTGYLDNEKARVLYSIAEAVVIPSICNEAFGMVMLEAAFYKKPIIATYSGGMPEIVPNNCVRFVNKDRDVIVDELAEAMKNLLDDKRMQEGRIEKCYRHVKYCGRFDRKDYYKNFKLIIDGV